MENNLHLPADYAPLTEDEMTYTQGGGAVDALGTVATIVGVCVMGASYIWGIGQTKQWLKENGTGNIFTVLGKGTDALLADMSKSFSNAARDAVAAVSVVALWPVSLVLLMLN